MACRPSSTTCYLKPVAPIAGAALTPAAERFAAYADAGATWLVLTAIGDDWHAQWELIAEAATLLD